MVHHIMSLLIYCSLMILNYVVTITTNTIDPVSEVLSAEGYKHEIHWVTTADRYVLKLHRIPPTKRNARPVLLVHAFKLADHGYDVWLVNCRCSDFTHHRDFQQTSPKYWQFSFHEMAKYDLPAVIDFVLKKTKHPFAHYVGHSQGTTVVMAMLSMFPEYNKKLKTVHLMAPSVYFGNAAMHIRTAAMFAEPVEQAFAAAGVDKTPNVREELAVIGGYVCSSKSVRTMEICKFFYHASGGPSSYLNQAMLTDATLTNIFRYILNQMSVMQIVHFAQLINTGEEFLQYDYKKKKNLLIYNQSTPLKYELSNVKTKIHILYGTTDLITSHRDVERLIHELRPRIIGIDKIVGYNHFDFVAANNIDELVNTKILNLMNRYKH